MTNRLLLLHLPFIVLFLAACQSNSGFNSPEYTGEPLTIGVVGDFPTIREKHIQFIDLTLQDIQKKKVKPLDAIIIGKQYLAEAAEKQYADMYVNSPVPIVFVDSDKVYLAFIDPNLSYEEAHDLQSSDYLTGYFNEQYFGIGLYNNKENRKSIEDCYSRLFDLLETAKNTGTLQVSSSP